MNVLNQGTAGDAIKAKAALIERIASGGPAPTPAPKKLPVDAIQRIPELFQPRNSDEWRSAAHINGLSSSSANAQQANDAARMEAVLVFWVGDAWVCLDGHHRLAAAAKKKKTGATIGVEVFSGTVQEAMMEATRRNSRNKLPMNEKDKTERAWQLFMSGAGTHKAIAEACGVAPKTIQRMAQAVKTHGTTDETMEQLRGFRWWQVRERTNPDAAGKLSFDEMKDGRIQRKAEVLGKAIGTEAPHIVAEALMLRDPDFAKAVMLQLRNIYLRNNPYNLGPDGLPEFPEEEPEGEPLEF
ncbi:MAG: hypothetical protein QE265_11935 [Rhodoferax sp.]|nr:hypothetical protein [Rhodoferax sp.]